MFSIVIPTWNNRDYLELCISSIRKNSHFNNQIIVFINEGYDGTREWIANQPDLDVVYAEVNRGICIALNSVRHLIRTSYLVYMNDDMYVCPGWDLELFKEIEKVGHNLFMISATQVEPYETGNPSYFSIIKNFGDSVTTFKEKELLSEYASLECHDWAGGSWPPSVVSLKTWDAVGGYSIEFSPGMYSDPDFSMKLWKYGVRIFKGIGASKVYHFQSKSTGRLKRNKGSDTFLLKWGITAKTFYQYYLKIGTLYTGPANELPVLPTVVRIKNLIKRTVKALRGSAWT
jgi:glycosyltransferase involved in cell wall biosynthesis